MGKRTQRDKFTVHTFYAGMTGYVVFKNGIEVYHGYSATEILDRFGIHPDDMKEVSNG